MGIKSWHPRALAIAAAAFMWSGRILSAQTPADVVTIRFGGPLQLAAGETAGAMVVVNGDAIIDGRLRDGLLVVNGTARINGQVDGSVAVVTGRAELGPEARIGENLVLHRSTVSRAAGATITGDTIEEPGFSFGRRFLMFAWIGATVTLTVAAAVFAAVGGRVLDRATWLLRTAPAAALLGAVIVYAGLPMLAFFAFVTVVGSGVGVAIVAVLLPGLWLLGYLAAGTWLGRVILPFLKAEDTPERPYAAAMIGITAAQVVGLIPVVGGLLVFLAGCVGAGALASLAWTGWRAGPAPAGA
ncbi:MAG: hypothetical protein AB7L66_05660 [Gemmatimonadales bacterium]